MTPKECYDKYKHLDHLLSDPYWHEGRLTQKLAYEFWITIKLAASKELLIEIRKREIQAGIDAGFIAAVPH